MEIKKIAFSSLAGKQFFLYVRAILFFLFVNAILLFINDLMAVSWFIYGFSLLYLLVMLRISTPYLSALAFPMPGICMSSCVSVGTRFATPVRDFWFSMQ